MARKRMILRSRLSAASGPNPGPKDHELDAELIPITDVPKVQPSFVASSHCLKPPKYRDPVHLILEYIAEVRAVGTPHKPIFLSTLGSNGVVHEADFGSLLE